MEYGCPVCNGLTIITQLCSCCGRVMGDSGILENYYGPYSPYDNMDLYEPPAGRNPANVLTCIHLFSCPNCGFDTRIAIRQVPMA